MSSDHKTNLVTCSEGNGGTTPPPTLLQAGGAARVCSRIILEWSSSLGSYGMGGPGFFGLKLSANDDYSEEWLVLTLWSACSWLLLDGHWLEAHPRYYSLQLPLFSNYGGMDNRDLVSPILIGAEVVEVVMELASSLMVLRSIDGSLHRLEIPSDTASLPRFGGSDLERLWYEYEDQRNAWVVSRGNLFI